MKHFHIETDSIDEALLAMKRYWELPDTYKFESEILEVNENLLRLKTNFFYPEGGGQPSDRGLIKAGKKQSKVVDVQETDNIVWIKTTEQEFEEGQLVKASIDQHRREILTQNHSAQHLVSAVFWDEFELETERALIEMQETEVEFDKKPSWENLEQGLETVNDYITRNIPIYSKIYDYSQASTLKLRGQVGKDHNIYRIVQIGDLDINPCGGTHVRNTGELGIVAIQRLDGKRLKFIAGNDGTKYLNHNAIKFHQVSADIGTNQEQLGDEVLRLYTQNKELQSEMQKIDNQLLELQVRTREIHSINDYLFSSVEVSNLNRGVIIDTLGSLHKKEIVFIKNQASGFVLSTGDEKLTSQLITYLREKGAKGGGRGTVVMGTMDSNLSIDEFIEDFIQSRS